MGKGSKTKDMILLEAYKLFASEPYDQVTFSDLERVTKLSRGAILYHVSKKDALFREVIERYVFERNSLQSLVEKNPTMGLKSFILAFLDASKAMKDEMKDLGILNVNMAMFNVECAAFFFSPKMKERAKEWIDNEMEVWKRIFNNAIESKEIKADTDVSLMASLFQDLCLGNSYHGVVFPKGQDLNMLKKELNVLYDMVKA